MRFFLAVACVCAVLFAAVAERDICRLSPDTGPCRAAIRLWYYNYHTKCCERFIYGGCKGNENRFETKKDCEERCKHK